MKDSSNNEVGDLTAILKAQEFIRDAGIDAVPVDLDKYLAKAGITLDKNYELNDGEAGRVIPLPNQSIVIEVNGNHSNERQRFTVLHEIAHIILNLPSNHDAVTTTDSLYKYNKRPQEEILCDIFAAECLFPRQFFKADVNNTDPCLDAVHELANQYEASLIATASRYAANTDELCASVLTEHGVIRYVSTSTMLRNQRFWIEFGSAVPERTLLAKLLLGRSQDKFAEQPAHHWTNTSSFATRMICEESIVLNAWDQALTLLWFEDEPPESQAPPRQFDEDDELLQPLDGQLPWPGRRKRK